MGERFTARLSEENAEWIETEAQERDRSKAWVLNEVVSAIRGAESTFSHRTGANHTGAHRTDDDVDLEDVLDRLADLEQRVGDLEEDEPVASAQSQDDDSVGPAQFDKAADGLSYNEEVIAESKTPADPMQAPGFDGEVDPRTRDAVVEATSNWVDSDDRLETRREAAALVLQYALDTGDPVGKSSEIVETARSSYPVAGQNEETHWRKNIRDVLQEFGEYDNAAHGYVIDGLDA